MKTRMIPLLLLAVVLMPGCLIAQKHAQAHDGWQLVWQDEFNGKSLDTTKWNVLLRETSKHNELQYYLPDEVYVENGILRIRSGRKVLSGRQCSRSWNLTR